jgi:aminopeptidase N
MASRGRIMAMAKLVRRLNAQFSPEHYDLVLKIDKKQMRFNGQVIIAGNKIGRPSKRLTFHQKDLTIESATIERSDKTGDRTIEVIRINRQVKFDEVRLHTEEILYPGLYKITISFSGIITRPMNGIYPCYFKNGSKSEELIATQFESHHAREAFPCIDEPEAKAAFRLTLITPEKEPSYISNMPVAKQTASSTAVVTKFETSPLMSTYLLAFVFGDLKYLEATTTSGVIVRAYATPANVNYTKFALEVAVKCLDFYNQYFKIDYPLPKCDLVALPDFSSGAMENWGCITFREQALLVDPEHTSLPVKQYVAMVIAHELAHMWFGNLVTMKWWNDLWLNEGFATWIEYLATDHNFPEWEMWTQFIVDEQEQALRLDCLSNTHPIDVPIRHPDEIRSIFDTISYSKGSSVIHMLYHYLGDDMFRDGLRHYLMKYSYKNPTTDDLWSSFEIVSKRPVRAFMHAWTSQSGYPIVSATLDETSFNLTQNRFQVNPKTPQSDQTWPIPLLTKPKIKTEIFADLKAKLTIPPSATEILVNHERSGFFRVVYDSAHLKQLAAQVAAGKLTPLDRLCLLSDSAESAKAGYSSSVETFNLLNSYQSESDSVVWDIMAAFFSSVRGIMDDEQIRQDLRPYLRRLVKNQLNRLGWETHNNEPYLDSILRPTILALAAVSDEPAVVSRAQSMFNDAKTSSDVPPDLRGVIYGTIARKGAEKEYNRMMEFYLASNNSEEQVTIAGGICSFKQPELIKQTLSLIISDEVRLQDIPYWVAYCFSNRHAKNLSWQWLKDNWQWLLDNMGDDLSFFRFPVYAAKAFSDEKFLREYNSFFALHRQPSLARSIDQGVEIIEWQSAWRKRDLLALKEFFKSVSA